MNSNTTVALAADKRTQYMAAVAQARLGAEAAAGSPRPSPMQGIRFSIGTVLIAVGGRLQGVAAALPEPQAIAPAVPTQPAAC